jgi:hypothetical protein
MLFLPVGCKTSHCTKIMSQKIGRLTLRVHNSFLARGEKRR